MFQKIFKKNNQTHFLKIFENNILIYNIHKNHIYDNIFLQLKTNVNFNRLYRQQFLKVFLRYRVY